MQGNVRDITLALSITFFSSSLMMAANNNNNKLYSTLEPTVSIYNFE